MKSTHSFGLGNPIMVKVVEKRSTLWGKYYAKLALLKHEQDKLLFIKDQINQTIDLMVSHKGYLDLIACLIYMEERNLKPNENNFKKAFWTPEIVLNKNIRSDYALFYKRRSEGSINDELKELLQLPKIDVFIDYDAYFIHLDHLYRNEEEIINGKSISLISNYSSIYMFINEMFCGMDDKGWAYAFYSESDFKVFINLLADYFEGNIYSFPEKPIKLKPRTKTKIAKVLREIYSEYKDKLSKNKEFLRLIKVLSHFKSLTDSDLTSLLRK